MATYKEFMVFLKKNTQDYLTFRIFDDSKNFEQHTILYDLVAKSTGVELMKFQEEELRKITAKFLVESVNNQIYEEVPNSTHFNKCYTCIDSDCNYCEKFIRILYFQNPENL